MTSLFRKSHSAFVGGYGTHTADVPCDKCGSMLAYVSDGSCVSCKKRSDNKPDTGADLYKKRREIENRLEQMKLEKELDDYAALRH